MEPLPGAFLLSGSCEVHVNFIFQEVMMESIFLMSESVDQLVQWFTQLEQRVDFGIRSFSENTAVVFCLYPVVFLHAATFLVLAVRGAAFRGKVNHRGLTALTLFFRRHLLEEGWVRDHVRGGPNSNSFCLEIWSEGFGFSLCLIFLFFKKKNGFILNTFRS